MTNDSSMATRSSFGSQALSTKSTEPTIKFPTSKRPANINKSDSPGPVHSITADTISHQITSAYTTAPACKLSGRLNTDNSTLQKRRSQPGPGTYETAYQTIGTPLAKSRQCSAPAIRIGKGDRWTEFSPKVNTGPPCQADVLTVSRLPAGYLGDAPAWRMAGKRPLYPGGFYAPPSNMATPGPGAYATVDASCFGGQVDARHATGAGVKMTKAQREAAMKLYVSREDETVLLCRTSTIGPNMAGTSSVGSQAESKRANPVGFRFGRSDRFSDIKPSARRASSATMLHSVKEGTVGPDIPGPGQYIV